MVESEERNHELGLLSVLQGGEQYGAEWFFFHYQSLVRLHYALCQNNSKVARPSERLILLSAIILKE